MKRVHAMNVTPFRTLCGLSRTVVRRPVSGKPKNVTCKRCLAKLAKRTAKSQQ